MTLARRVLLAAAALAAAVVAARFALGPFRLHWTVTTPVNAEGFLGLVLTALFLTAPKGSVGTLTPAAASRRAELALCACAALAVLAAFGRILGLSFLSDDFIIVQRAPTQTLAVLLRSFTEGAGDGFFRPLGTVAFTVNSWWAGVSPFRWHLSALALHAVVSVLVVRLALALGASRFNGLMAGLLFAVHGTRPEVVAWIAATYDLLATLFVLSGFLLFIRSRSAAGLPRRCCEAAALVCMILALMSKESAYIFPLLVLLYVLTDRERREGRIRAVLPFLAVALAVFAYRWSLFGGIGGYSISGDGRPQVLSLGFASTLKALLVRMWAALYFPINWSSEPGAILAGLAFGYLACLVWLGAGSGPTRQLWFPIGWTLISVVPPLHLLAVGPDLWNSRVLYLPSVGFCLFLALAAGRAGHVFRPLVFAVLLAFQVAALEHNLRSWEYAASKLQSACAMAAEQAVSARRLLITGVPKNIRGAPVFANGFPQCVELRLGRRADAAVLWDPSKADLEPDATLLIWDGKTGNLRCARACF